MTTPEPPNPSFMDTVVNIRGKDYFFAAAGVVSAFFLLDKPGTPASLRLKYGLIASVGSFSYACMKSFGRLKGNLDD